MKARFLVFGLLLAGCSSPNYSAQVVSAEVGSIPNSNARAQHEALINWKNTGDAPIGVVYADIKAYSADGEMINEVKDYTIFVAEASEGTHEIAPGETYTEAPGMGFALVDQESESLNKVPAKVEASITRVGPTPSYD